MKSTTLLLLLLIPISVSARTWTVMQDGSGDYTDPQAAVDGCAVGDTVLLGPGRYDGYHPWQPGGSNLGYQVVIGVSVDSLTIRGLDRDNVLIGPDQAREERAIYIGITTSVATTWIDIENLTIENVYSRGAHLYPSGRVANCTIRDCDMGILFEHGVHAVVEDCIVERCIVLSVSSGGNYAVVRDSQFRMATVSFSRHPHAEVYNCTFEDGLVGIQGTADSNVYIRDCVFSGNGNYGIVGSNLGAGLVDIRNCRISGHNYGAIRMLNTHLTGSGNILQSNAEYTITGGNYSAAFHGNHILKSQVGAVVLHYYNIPDAGLDFSGNWWGTTDTDSLAAWIHDGADDPELEANVVFDPMLDGPVAAERSSVGGLKGMFR